MTNKNMLLARRKQQLDWFIKPTPDHTVQFYSSKQALLTPLQTYIGAGLLNGDTCIIIAKKIHVEELENRLTANGLDVSRMQKRGQYIALDATQTLEQFMIDGLPDSRLFNDVIGGALAAAARNGNSVRAYGEMVALLWEDGNKEAVMMLENLWNKIMQKHHIALYCAYPQLHFIMHPEAITEIAGCHKHYVPSLA